MAGILLGAYWALFVCSFYRYVPLQAIWIGGFFALIGGGPGVTNAMVMTMISDVIDEANRSVEAVAREYEFDASVTDR